MKTETTTQHIELKKTLHICEEDGCNFSTADEHEAATHPWKKHQAFKTVRFDLDPNGDLRTDSTLVFFESEEAYRWYQEIQEYERLRVEKWGGPGWYETWCQEVPCGHGCCTKTALFLRPGTQTLDALRTAQQELNETLEMLQQMGVGCVVG